MFMSQFPFIFKETVHPNHKNIYTVFCLLLRHFCLFWAVKINEICINNTFETAALMKKKNVTTEASLGINRKKKLAFRK